MINAGLISLVALLPLREYEARLPLKMGVIPGLALEPHPNARATGYTYIF